jgi:hypothetical protein
MTDQFDPAARRVRGAARAAQATAHEVLSGRMLLQVSPRRVGYFAAHLYPDRSGLILSGPEPTGTAARLRRASHDGVVLTDPARYLDQRASQQQPFIPAPDQAMPLDPLEDAVLTQLARGADAAISPTGYIEAEDTAALLAAATKIAEFDDPRVVFAVPISNAWLRGESIKQLIAILKDTPGVKAVMLGGQKDPIGAVKEGVANLRMLIEQVPGVALMRTDIAAFGALAHGAEFAAFGMGSSQRHIIPPGQKPEHSPISADSPSVLYPELMGFFLGMTLARRYAVAPAHLVPTCACEICGGAPIDRFTTRAHEREAMAHNVAVMMRWSGRLAALAAQRDPRGWWAEVCAVAAARCDEVNSAINAPGAFKVPAQLAQWAAGLT